MRVLGDFIFTGRNYVLAHGGKQTSLRLHVSRPFQVFVYRVRKLPPKENWLLEPDHCGRLVLGYRDTRCHMWANIALVGYTAEHKRQRIKPKLCTVADILVTGNYGRSVIAAMDIDDKLVFHHRQYEETVFFDGDKLVTNTKELT